MILIEGMHGLGDNLHQRAIMRQLMKHHNEVWLISPWFSVYHDLVAQGLNVQRKISSLRTQHKNSRREANLFKRAPLNLRRARKVWYAPNKVRECGGVLPAMMASFPECAASQADFRLPVPADWIDAAQRLIATYETTKPIMIYRPLNERTEWLGCRARNPDHAAYYQLLLAIREHFFTVSVADFEAGKEWQVGFDIKADIEYHKGELSFEMLAGMWRLADLVVSAPGFALVLAQAVETPAIGVFGTYERGYSFSAGAKFSPFLAIEPVTPRDTFTHDVRHNKEIAIPAALASTHNFVAPILAKGNARFNRNPPDKLGPAA